MLAAFPFHTGDAHLLEDLLEWIKSLGGCKGHDAVLVADSEVPWDAVVILRDLAKASFDTVAITTNKMHVDGWIQGSNSLWLAAAKYAHEHSRPFWFHEPDCIPLCAGWLGALESAWNLAGTPPYFGALVSHSNAHLPNPYLEGCSIYHAHTFMALAPTFDINRSWTLACAPTVMQRAVHTPLVHHFWGEQNLPPTFSDLRVQGSPPNTLTLANINRDAVVFHRNKDGTLIRLLRQKLNLCEGEQRCYVQMGRIGDLILLLPAWKAIAERIGRNPVVVSSVEFGNVLSGASYVTPVLLPYHWGGQLQQAIHFAKANYPNVTCTQLHGNGVRATPDSLASYSLSMWARTGLLDEYVSLPLVFDRRDPQREAVLIARYRKTKKPLLLYSNSGQTSPLRNDGGLFTNHLGSISNEFEIVNVGEIRLRFVYDLLGLFDIASGLITIDTMHLHLAAASKIPYIALVRDDGQSGSVPKGNCVLKVGYGQVPKSITPILDILKSWTAPI